MMRGAVQNILETVGHTPIVKLNNVTRHIKSEIYVKCEYLNPGGSMKDRVAINIVTDAERADGALLRDERAAEVRAAIARLPKKQRAALILRVYHELPHEEIAEVLGSSVGAVKANFFHALANLKKLLQGGS